MKKFLLLFLLLGVLITSCKKDEAPEPTPPVEQPAPGPDPIVPDKYMEPFNRTVKSGISTWQKSIASKNDITEDSAERGGFYSSTEPALKAGLQKMKDEYWKKWYSPYTKDSIIEFFYKDESLYPQLSQGLPTLWYQYINDTRSIPKDSAFNVFFDGANYLFHQDMDLYFSDLLGRRKK